MITSHRTFGLLGAATFLAFSAFFQSSVRAAETPQDNQPLQVNRLRVGSTRQGPARPASARKTAAKTQTTSQGSTRVRQSLVAKAVDGQILDGPPQPPLDGSLVDQADHHQYAVDCGPVCDCADCASEVACGIEEIYPAGGGIEIGCGLGVAIDKLGPVLGGGCDVEGCTDCVDSVAVLEEACGIEEIYMEGPGCGTETYGHCSCDACTSCEVDCIPLFLPLVRINWNRYEFFAGHQGFKGPLNFADIGGAGPDARNGSGSFGFYQGFNHGHSIKLWRHWECAGQFGLRATQSNLSGAMFTSETRNQVFVTGGLFRRVDYGLQYGLVVDYLSGDWYYQSDLTQLRGELSWRCKGCHVWGFQFMAGLGDDSSDTTVRDGSGGTFNTSISFEATDQYRLFYRQLLRHNGQWNAFAGWTDHDDGILGSNLSMPLMPRLSLATGVTYLIPNQGSNSGGNQEEGWNIGIGFVFRPGGHNGAGRYCRPMFDVADNGTFMVDRK